MSLFFPIPAAKAAVLIYYLTHNKTPSIGDISCWVPFRKKAIPFAEDNTVVVINAFVCPNTLSNSGLFSPHTGGLMNFAKPVHTRSSTDAER